MHLAALPRRDRTLSTAGAGGVRRGTWLAIVAIALTVAVTGVVLQARRQAAAEARPVATATLGGLNANLGTAGWVSMDGHQSNDQGGFQMPAQMMPGAPEGDDMRLGVPLTLMNTSRQARRFTLADEFLLGGGRNDTLRTLHSDTFGQLPQLEPGNAVNGVLYFDTIVPGAGDPPLFLQWARDGHTVRLAVPLTASEVHQHSP
jgi:hypothetical protein